LKEDQAMSGEATQASSFGRPTHGRRPGKSATGAMVDRSPPLLVALRYAVILILCAISLLPVYAAFVTSLTEYENVGNGYLLPYDWAWHNYVDVWSQIPLLKYTIATAIYAFSSAVGCVVVGTLAAWALSRTNFLGKQTLLYSLLVSQVIPMIVVAVPLFALVRAVGLFDTYLGISLVVMGVHLAFPIMFLKSYFDGIPRDMEEAAQVDGCNQLQALVRIMLPSARPALFTTFALVFFTSWQIFLIPLILAISDDKTPVTVGIFRLLSDSYTPWQYVMAASIIASIPPIAVFLIAQRQLIGGLTAGAVK
jgi:ABC-type glycerol-3-phosphate transport system permease component